MAMRIGLEKDVRLVAGRTNTLRGDAARMTLSYPLTSIRQLAYPCKRLLGLAALVVVLTGCASLGDVAGFAGATNTMVSALEIQYDQTLATHRQAVAASTVLLDTPSFENAVSIEIYNGYYARKMAMEALRTYSVALKSMADFNDDEDIDAAAKSLTSNLNALAVTYGTQVVASKLPSFVPEGLIRGVVKSQVNLKPVGDAVAKLAKAFVELKIKKELRKAISNAQDPINELLKHVLKDVNDQADRMRRLEGAVMDNNVNLWTELRYADVALKSIIDKGRNSGPPREELNAERARLTIEAQAMVLHHYVRSQHWMFEAAFIEKLEATVESCKAAHNVLLLDNSDTKVTKFIADVNALSRILP